MMLNRSMGMLGQQPWRRLRDKRLHGKRLLGRQLYEKLMEIIFRYFEKSLETHRLVRGRLGGRWQLGHIRGNRHMLGQEPWQLERQPWRRHLPCGRLR